ncbi:D-Tyr tRNAtyr deacylase-like domain-containing protein [Mycena vitilis]|nr:D-Tyr tRNAtyr deacylase-like domain-containing protein [Mycena vitilis]
MRAVVQRVTSASVSVDGQVISQISRGLMILVGIGTGKPIPHDTESDVSTLTNKILSLRVFSDHADSSKLWKTNVKDLDGDILCVSQFTLMAQTKKGNKPDFHNAMKADESRALYETFLEALHSRQQASTPFISPPLNDFADGKFGAMMNVSLTNEGPVTFTLDSRRFEYTEDRPSANKKHPKSQMLSGDSMAQ